MNQAPPPYSPSLVDPAALDATTVGHERLLETVVDGLSATIRDGGARFELLVGPPGAGKTHLLRALYQRVKANARAGAAHLVLLDERAPAASLSDLFARTIEQLGGGQDALRRARQLERDEALQALEARIEASRAGKPLLLFVEDLGTLLEVVGGEDQHWLRAALQNRGGWSIITTGQRPSPVFTSASAPLFATFAVRTLEPLSAEQCHQLWTRRHPDAPSRATARALHHLLGGWPRPMVLAQRWAAVGPKRPDIGALVLALAEALEPELSCLERQLPRGRGAVLQTIVNHARPSSPTDIAEQLHGMSRSAVTAQLKILRDEGAVQAHRVGRSSYYELASASHRLVAARRTRPAELATLGRFLEAWYRQSQGSHGELGRRSAHRPGDALTKLDLVALAGLSPAVVGALRRALQLRAEGSAELPAAVTDAAHRYAQCSAAERLLLDQCLQGLGVEGLLGELVRMGR